jgi:hypothetical protein
VLSAVELKSLVEGRLLAELDEGSSLGLAVISGQQLDLKDVAAGLEEVSDVTVVGLERKAANADFEGSLLIVILGGLFLNGFRLLSGLLDGLSDDCLFGRLLLFLVLAGLLLGNDLGSTLLGNWLHDFLRLLFGFGFDLLSDDLGSSLLGSWLDFLLGLFRRRLLLLGRLGLLGGRLSLMDGRFNGLDRGFNGFLGNWLLFLRFFLGFGDLGGFLHDLSSRGNGLLNGRSNFLHNLSLGLGSLFRRFF